MSRLIAAMLLTLLTIFASLAFGAAKTHSPQALPKPIPPLIGDSIRSDIYLLPVLAYNTSDKLLPGLVIFNDFSEKFPVRLMLMPLFSTAKNQLMGQAWAYYHFNNPSGFFKTIIPGSHLKRYSSSAGVEPFSFLKIENSLQLFLSGTPAPSQTRTFFSFSHAFISRDVLRFALGQPTIVKEQFHINTLLFHHSEPNHYNPYSLELDVQQHKAIVRSSATLKMLFSVNEQQQGLHIRLFGGTFLSRPDAISPAADMRFRLQNLSGPRDYAYRELFVGRNQTAGTFWGNQYYEADAGFKYPTPLGQTWHWMASMNLLLDVPRVPVRLFLDVATYHDAANPIIGSEQFPWVAGIQFHLLRDLILVNFPIFVSDDIKRTATLNNLTKFSQTITFSLRFDRINATETYSRQKLILQ